MEEIKDDDNVKEINNTDDVEIGRLIEDSTNFENGGHEGEDVKL